MLSPSLRPCCTTQSMAAITWDTSVAPAESATLTLTMRYRRSRGRLRKIYLGTAQQVTRERLVKVVRQLLAEQYQCRATEIPLTCHH